MGTTSYVAERVALVDAEFGGTTSEVCSKTRYGASSVCLFATLPDLRPSPFGCPPPPFGQPRALGRRVSDEFIVPLCRVHHRELHRRGDEKKWWQATSIDPLEVAQKTLAPDMRKKCVRSRRLSVAQPAPI